MNQSEPIKKKARTLAQKMVNAGYALRRKERAKYLYAEHTFTLYRGNAPFGKQCVMTGVEAYRQNRRFEEAFYASKRESVRLWVWKITKDSQDEWLQGVKQRRGERAKVRAGKLDTRIAQEGRNAKRTPIRRGQERTRI